MYFCLLNGNALLKEEGKLLDFCNLKFVIGDPHLGIFFKPFDIIECDYDYFSLYYKIHLGCIITLFYKV